MLPKLVCLFLTLALSIQAVQVANLNVSESVAAKYDCGKTCYKNLQKGLAIDREAYGALYDPKFYATSPNFAAAKPGDALKLEPINPDSLTDIPKGTTAYRFQYVSSDLNGTKVPATGFIAFPYACRFNGHTFPAIAYAHGTSGVFPGCAPSVRSDLYEYGSWGFLVSRGYAVVATDYAGLGNNHTAHQYQASQVQAQDLYFSMAAAQKLFNNTLTREWMSVGHSQGGGAAWALAEGPLLKRNPLGLGRYLGTVAQAPGVAIGDMARLAIMEALSPGSDPSDVMSARGLLGELGWLALGLRSILPEDPQTWLQPRFKKRLELAKLAQACYASMQSLVVDLNITEVANLSDPSLFYALETMQNLTARGDEKSDQPLLIVQGLNDVSVLPEVVVQSHNVSCRSGNEAHLQLYPGLDHDPVIPASAPSYLQWMDDRFFGVKTKGARCINETVQPFNARYMYAPDDSD